MLNQSFSLHVFRVAFRGWHLATPLLLAAPTLNHKFKSSLIRLNQERSTVVKVIASGVRKGNVIEHEDGKLYVVLKAESMHPGKGTPTTTIDMRRISDGVKTVVRYKTTDNMERAFVETVMHTYLYQDGENYVFMNPTSYEQITLHGDMVGDAIPYLQEGMECQIALFNEGPISIEIPQRVTLEITETEPAIKNQTASSSFKPAILSNGVRTLVPPHVISGTRIVVETSDGSYVERAKD
jgi:elongation factor P